MEAGLKILRVVGNAELVSKEEAEARARAEMEDRQNEPYILGLSAYSKNVGKQLSKLKIR